MHVRNDLKRLVSDVCKYGQFVHICSLYIWYIWCGRFGFDWTNMKLLNHAKTREARELKEAWQLVKSRNRHIDVPSTPTAQQHQQTFNTHKYI